MCKRKKHKLKFTIFYPHINLYLKGVTEMVLPDDKKAVLSIAPKDKKGHPARIDGIPAWMSSDVAIVDVQVASDGLSAVVLGGSPGTAQVSVMADADLGDGIELLTGIEDVEVVPGKAVSLAISVGPLEDQ